MPELSIIIVHHRTPGFLKMCLKSLKTVATGIDHEVIVVDSKATRESKEIVSELAPEAIYLSSKENLGYSRGVNTGLKIAKGDFLLVLNPDIIITGDNLLKLLEFMKKHPDVGMAGPQLRNFNGTVQNSYFRFYRPITIVARRVFGGKFDYFKNLINDFQMSDVDPNKIQTPDWIMGSMLMINRNALEKVGLMDERFFMYFEDVDWARRFWHNGYKVVYFPKAFVYHYHRHESKTKLGVFDAIFNKKTRWHIVSAVKFFMKYRDLSVVRKISHAE
ncbi:MAG: glycosyltransferase family 2 protein [Minisyncoccia bacterium]|jgi:GT2 family glycosyltransferase